MGILSALLLALAISGVFTQDSDTGLTVQTQQGFVTGSLISPNVREFLGIPYALVNRWKPPQKPAVRNTTFKATAYGDSCVQDLSASHAEFLKLVGLGKQHVLESEQCLSLNIWAPSLDRKQGGAVMIWLYGGAYAFGTSNTIVYEGRELIGNNDDVLLVTINYRTNIFGFPGAPQFASTTQSQNFGALDVDAAIQWVYDNIALFGGDPERITIFGQSAGSGLIAAYTFANPDDTRVKGVIQQSGSLAGLTPALSSFGRPLNPSAWNKVANAVGCGSSATASQLTCMNSVPATTLESAIIKAGNNFVPVQDGRVTGFCLYILNNINSESTLEITFFSDATARSAVGDFLHVPLLVGNTKQEGDIFIVNLEQRDLGFDIPGLTTLGSDAITKVVFSCPAGTTAADHSKVGAPTWRYRYDAVFPDISTRSDLNAFHTSEVPIVLGTYNASPFAPPTPDEITFSKYMQGAWVAFARNPERGLVEYGWPLYNRDTESLAILGSDKNRTGVVFSSGSDYDFGCGASEVMGSLALRLIDLVRGVP